MEKSTSRQRRFRKARKSRIGLWSALAIGLLLALYLLVIVNSRPHVDGDRLRLDSFVELVQRGQVRDARVLDQDEFVVGSYVRDDGTPATYNAPYLASMGHTNIGDLLLDNSVPTEVDHQFTKRLLMPASMVLPALIVVVVFIYLIVSYQRGTGLFSVRSGARRAELDDEKVTFADIAGQDAAITELREIKGFLSDPERFTALGARVPKGILLFGPPGCGKTLLARAVAGEAGAAFYSISGSDFVELFAGVGAARVRDLFVEARENAPAIVFIDELDSVGRRRGGETVSRSGNHQEQEQALNQILAELDGFSPLQGIIVIGATNRPDVLDPALLRPGRFDRTIGLQRPDEGGRLAILRVHGRDKPLETDVDLAELAKRGIGLSGADLASVMNEGALLAARAGKQTISQSELDQALERILEAPERQRRLSMRQRSFVRSGRDDARVGFADVAGVDEAVAELADVRDYLTDPERFIALGARPPRGFLVVGPPGCGKTLLAKAVAAEANAAFFSVAASEFVEVFAGEGAGRVRDLFAEARSAAPSIVFLDEIDAVGSRRGVSADGGREREQTLNQILIELDGFGARDGVIVMAASNRPEILDEALVRPGRFDRTITLNLPDLPSRRAILEVHRRNKRLGEDVDLDLLAGLTQGFSGADLANVMNEAALLSGRQNMAMVPMALLEEAVQRVGLGLARTQILTAEDRAVVAYHEVGHALVARALTKGPRPHKVSIVARGRTLGSTWHLDQPERAVQPRSVLIGQMAALLGGRAAEDLVFGEPSSGGADDFERVTAIAYRMVCELGMSDVLGPRNYGTAGAARNGPDGYSEEATRAIEAEVGRLVDDAYAKARAVIEAARPMLDRAAQALLERETLSSDELDAVLEPPGPSLAGPRLAPA